MARPTLSAEALFATSRSLLVEGGPDAVVVREVARRLGVTAPALYRHVSGRDDLLTLLITACTEEVTGACAAALASCRPDDVEGWLPLRWAFGDDATTFVAGQLDDLAEELLLPAPAPTGEGDRVRIPSPSHPPTL